MDTPASEIDITTKPIIQHSLGDRIKFYERETENRIGPEEIAVVRLDGRGFSRLTARLDKPDWRFNAVMAQTAQSLCGALHAALVYTQSDEITVVLPAVEDNATMLFDGRVQKLGSIAASLATAYFTRHLLASEIAELADHVPVFDARVFAVPDMSEAANAILWRVRDCTKNATSMVARDNFSALALHGKSSEERREMLRMINIDFDSYPDDFRNGSFWARVTKLRNLTSVERARIPVDKQPPADATFMRSSVERCPMPDRINYADIEALLV